MRYSITGVVLLICAYASFAHADEQWVMHHSQNVTQVVRVHEHSAVLVRENVMPLLTPHCQLADLAIWFGPDGYDKQRTVLCTVHLDFSVRQRSGKR